MRFLPSSRIVLGFLALTLGLGRESALQAQTTAQARPGRYIVGLSPYLDDAGKNAAYQHLVRFLIQDLPINSSLWIYDAYHLTTVAQINIPDLRAFASSRTRVNQFKDALLVTRRFLAEDHPRPTVSGLQFDRAVRLPQFLRFVGENLAETEKPPVVVILGSPLYMDEKELSFSMVDGYFPSDGHLLAPRDKSVYGVKDAENLLRNVTVHFGYFGDPWTTDLQQEKISRFWGLYVQMQGGRLATFSGDLPTVFNAIRCSDETSVARGGERPAVDPTQTKVEMIRLNREVGLADWITREGPVGNPASPPSSTVGPMKIGIRWQGNIDLDLYARPQKDGETLYFQHNRSDAGYYYKDHRSSPDREFEFIEFQEPVDVFKVESSINFYKGSAPMGPTGEIRVEFEGRIYSGRFSIESHHGNQGRGGDEQSTYWAPIDLPKLLKLR